MDEVEQRAVCARDGVERCLFGGVAILVALVAIGPQSSESGVSPGESTSLVERQVGDGAAQVAPWVVNRSKRSSLETPDQGGHHEVVGVHVAVCDHGSEPAEIVVVPTEDLSIGAVNTNRCSCAGVRHSTSTSVRDCNARRHL